MDHCSKYMRLPSANRIPVAAFQKRAILNLIVLLKVRAFFGITRSRRASPRAKSFMKGAAFEDAGRFIVDRLRGNVK
jgi:hypothetical protein